MTPIMNPATNELIGYIGDTNASGETPVFDAQMNVKGKVVDRGVHGSVTLDEYGGHVANGSHAGLLLR